MRSRCSARALKRWPSSSSPTRITKISLPSIPRGPRSSTMTPCQLKAGSFEVTWSPTFSESADDVRLRAMSLKVSPRTGKSERLAAIGCDLIERCSQDVERAAPATARGETDCRGFQGASLELGVNVVVRDGVAPRDERPELLAALFVAAALPMDIGPYVKPEACKVSSDRVGLRVVPVKHRVVRQAPVQEHRVVGVVCPERDGVRGLRVQRAGESLEACREQHCVGVVELLGQEPPARLGPSDRLVRVLDLIERRPRIGLPLLQRLRCHETRRYNSAPTPPP